MSSNPSEPLRRPTASVAEARQAPTLGGAPSAPGLYAWWAERLALPGVEGPAHPSEPLELLYIGIAPSRLSSGTSIRKRLVGQHLGGNIGSSTFRLTLASLLWEQQTWQPCWKGDRAMLSAEDNAALSEWQEDHLRVSWSEWPEPWSVEATVIAELKPPLNLADNSAHVLYRQITQARTALRDFARERPC